MEFHDIERTIVNSPLAYRAKDILALVRPAIRITIEPHSHVSYAGSKFGGNPALPDSIRWPISENGSPFDFIAQFKLEDLPSIGGLENIQLSGILYLFLNYNSDFSGSSGQCFEFRHQADLGETRYLVEVPEKRLTAQSLFGRSKLFSFFGLHDSAAPILKAHPEAKIKYNQIFMLPCSTEGRIAGSALSRAEVAEYDAIYDDLFGHLSPEFVGTFFGWSLPVQDDCMEEECVAASGLGMPSDWRLLLQLESIYDCGMNWGDGLIYFWILEEDLQMRRFDRVRMINQFT